MNRIVILVQARMASSRMPGKVMAPILGRPLLELAAERISRSRLSSETIIITTIESQDDPIADLAASLGYPCFRGHPNDLLDRHYKAALDANAQIVLKIPSDCPLIDPEIIDRGIQLFLDAKGSLEFLSNLHPPTYPDGNDVEIMSIQALEQAWREASKPHEREHTTPYLWDCPGRFNIANFQMDDLGTDHSMTRRWTIDYPEDYAFIKAVFEALYPNNPRFSFQDIQTLVESRPDIPALNAKFAGVNWYRHHLDDLATITADKTKNPHA